MRTASAPCGSSPSRCRPPPSPTPAPRPPLAPSPLAPPASAPGALRGQIRRAGPGGRRRLWGQAVGPPPAAVCVWGRRGEGEKGRRGAGRAGAHVTHDRIEARRARHSAGHNAARVMGARRRRGPRRGRGGLCADEGGLSFVTLACFSLGILHINENGEGGWQEALV
jgi:hypothetical protein